jgi:chromosome segregation ATPase
MNLVDYLMAQQDLKTDLISGMAELFEENRKQRAAELAGLHDRLSYLSRQVEAMRATHSRNLEALSDRMHERTELSEKRYTQIMMEINSLKERIGDLEKLVYEMANHLPQSTEEPT